MKSLKKLLVTFVLTFFIMSFISIAETHEVAEESIGPNGVSWLPKVSFAELVLTVSRPDGTVFRKTFKSGSTPYFDLSENSGAIANGSYIYELRVTPAINRVREPGKSFLNASAKGSGTAYEKALTQSGAFFVRDGAIVSRGVPEPGGRPVNNLYTPQGGVPAKPLDVCYNDDLIVDGSLCVGFDCTCNYSFGFDTIVLKENNLRIFFDDTSSSASFPRNDWRIVINDSTNGGASYFGVEDSTAGRRVFTLEAGAPSHSLYVDDGGRVGFGTSTPVVDMHAKSGNTPTLRLEQDGSSGFTPQTFDVAANEANFFIRDATNGSTLPFRIQPGAPSSVLTIRADGRVGIGTWSPSFPVHLVTGSSTNAVIQAERTSGATAQMAGKADKTMLGSYTNHPVNITVNDAPKVTIDTAGYIGVGDTSPSYPMEFSSALANGARLLTNGNWDNPSSRELKENIRNLTADEALETLNGLNPVKFKYKVDKEDECLGFIAEDVPELVAVKDRKGMLTMDVVAVLTKVMQEQQNTVTGLKNTISELKNTISELNKKIAGLEKKSQSDSYK